MYQHHLHQYHHHTHGSPNVYEVHSTFFTSNPLLYFSHYSEIIVTHSGYESVSASSRVKPPASNAMTTPSQLSNQRQLVELLDTESVIDYLVQNGALRQKDVELLEGEKSQAKVNLTLLKCLETNGQHAQNLLVNALRQTGQLHLASLLDEGIRIRTFTGSGYLSKKRHRGQLTLEIEIKALKFDQASVLSALSANRKSAVITREWVSVDDLCRRISVLSESQTALSSSVHIVESLEDDHKKPSCFCACLSAIFSSSSKKKKNKKKKSSGSKYLAPPPAATTQGSGEDHISNNRGTSPSRYISRTTTHITSASSTPSSRKPSLGSSQQELARLTRCVQSPAHRTSLENLKNLLDLFTQKGDDVNRVLQDPASRSRDGLIKYFEQGLGVLVLDTQKPFQDGEDVIGGGDNQNTHTNNNFCVNIICTKTTQISDLRRDLLSGKVTRDIEGKVVTEEVLTRTGLLGIRLKAFVSEDELDLAENELS